MDPFSTYEPPAGHERVKQNFDNTDLIDRRGDRTFYQNEAANRIYERNRKKEFKINPKTGLPIIPRVEAARDLDREIRAVEEDLENRDSKLSQQEQEQAPRKAAATRSRVALSEVTNNTDPEARTQDTSGGVRTQLHFGGKKRRTAKKHHTKKHHTKKHHTKKHHTKKHHSKKHHSKKHHTKKHHTKKNKRK